MRILATFLGSLIGLALLYQPDRIAERSLFDAFVIPHGSTLHPPSIPRAVDSPHCETDALQLYETWEIAVPNDRDYANPFDFEEITLTASFISPSGVTFHHQGFYDGIDNELSRSVWRVRFAPDEAGNWQYRYQWTDSEEVFTGSFRVIRNPAPGNYGHVRVDPDNPRYLIHADGSPHYWIGGKWISAPNYGPAEKGGQQNSVEDRYGHLGRKSDDQLLDYLDLLHRYKHNGLLLKIALYPLEQDLISWDLEWIQRGEWLVREAQKRGIYVQINMFDTWSRKKNVWFSYATDGEEQPFDVWRRGNERAKKNYIRTIVSRFSGFSNVYWELGNEMEHSPNCGECFVERANAEYIPWVRESDPYDLPIGLSEGVWLISDVDIGFIHQPNEMPNPNWTRPVIMNELVRSGYPLSWYEKLYNRIDFIDRLKIRDGNLWQDELIRNADWRYMYRETFWQVFTHGGSGASEATWLDLDKPINEAVANVMADHWRLRRFLDDLPISINETYADTSLIRAEDVKSSARTDGRNVFIGYLRAGHKRKAAGGQLAIALPEGFYATRWYEPTTGEYSDTFFVRGGAITLTYPDFFEDLVLLVTRIPNGGSDLAE